MNYPIELDGLLSKDKILKDINMLCDNTYEWIKEQEQNKNRSIRNPHKINKHIRNTMINYFRNTTPDFRNVVDENKTCENGYHVPTNMIGINLYSCELCTAILHVEEMSELDIP